MVILQLYAYTMGRRGGEAFPPRKAAASTHPCLIEHGHESETVRWVGHSMPSSPFQTQDPGRGRASLKRSWLQGHVSTRTTIYEWAGMWTWHGHNCDYAQHSWEEHACLMEGAGRGLCIFPDMQGRSLPQVGKTGQGQWLHLPHLTSMLITWEGSSMKDLQEGRGHGTLPKGSSAAAGKMGGRHPYARQAWHGCLTGRLLPLPA